MGLRAFFHTTIGVCEGCPMSLAKHQDHKEVLAVQVWTSSVFFKNKVTGEHSDVGTIGENPGIENKYPRNLLRIQGT